MQLRTDIAGLREEDAYPAAPAGCVRLGEAVRRAAVPVLPDGVRDWRPASCGSTTSTGRTAPTTVGARSRRRRCAGRWRSPTTATSIEMWGDGEQTRSFCYIDDCVEGIYRLMHSDYDEPLNLGTERMVSINELARIIMQIAGKQSLDRAHRRPGRRPRPQLRQHETARGSRLGAGDRSRGGSRRDLSMDREAACSSASDPIGRGSVEPFDRPDRRARRRYQRDRSRRRARRDHALDRRTGRAVRVRHRRARGDGVPARSRAACASTTVPVSRRPTACRWCGPPGTRALPTCNASTGPISCSRSANAPPNAGWGCYLYGSSDEVLDRLRSNLSRSVPRVCRSSARYSPPFRALTRRGRRRRRRARSTSRALGSCGSVSARRSRSVGWRRTSVASTRRRSSASAPRSTSTRATCRQAPKWMQRSGLEWLFRLASEPRRLWRRYLLIIPRFLFGVARHRPRVGAGLEPAGLADLAPDLSPEF